MLALQGGLESVIYKQCSHPFITIKDRNKSVEDIQSRHPCKKRGHLQILAQFCDVGGKKSSNLYLLSRLCVLTQQMLLTRCLNIR